MNMENLKKVLAMLDGKKTLIVGILATLMSYLALKGWVGDAELVLFNGILTVLGFGASYATKKIG